jgi:hypothetical protein
MRSDRPETMPAAGFARQVLEQSAGGLPYQADGHRGRRSSAASRRRPAVQGNTSACPLCGDLRDFAVMTPAAYAGVEGPHFSPALFGPLHPTRAVTAPAWCVPLDRKCYPAAALPQRAGPGPLPRPQTPGPSVPGLCPGWIRRRIAPQLCGAGKSRAGRGLATNLPARRGPDINVRR